MSKVSDIIGEQMEGWDVGTLSHGYRWTLPEGHTDLPNDPAQSRMIEALVEISSSPADAQVLVSFII